MTNERADKKAEMKEELINWLNQECPHATMTGDLSHDFADGLRARLDKLNSTLPPAEPAMSAEQVLAKYETPHGMSLNDGRIRMNRIDVLKAMHEYAHAPIDSSAEILVKDIVQLFNKYYEYVYTTDDAEQRGEWKRDFARQIKQMFAEKQPATMGEMSEAIEFAEWILDNDILKAEDGRQEWMMYENDFFYPKSSTDIYQSFLRLQDRR